MGDTFWHMWHHLDAVTWHMSWRHMCMTVVKIHCLLHTLFVNRDIFWCRCDKVMRLVVVFTKSRSVRIQKWWNNVHVTFTDDLMNIWDQTSFNLSFRNRTCSYETELILVSILTFPRSGISKTIKINRLTLTVDLQNQGHQYILLWPSVSLVVCIVQTWSRCRF